MAINASLLIPFAAALIKVWSKKGFDPAKIPDETDVATALNRLTGWDTDLRDLLEAAIKKGGNVPVAATDAIVNAISQFQRQAGDGLLTEDGILGRKTLQVLLASLGCADRNPTPKDKLPPGFQMTDAQGKSTSEFWFQYFVESSPNLPGVHAIIDRAWDSWMEFAHVRARRVKEKRLANVIIKLKYLDGPGSVLGEAHIGPPTAYILDLDMDSGQNWTPELFEGAICHEIGHILGLKHDAVPGRLMSEILPKGMTKPTAADGSRAAALPHLGPAEKDPEPLTGIPPKPGPNAPRFLQLLWEERYGGK